VLLHRIELGHFIIPQLVNGSGGWAAAAQPVLICSGETTTAMVRGDHHHTGSRPGVLSAGVCWLPSRHYDLVVERAVRLKGVQPNVSLLCASAMLCIYRMNCSKSLSEGGEGCEMCLLAGQVAVMMVLWCVAVRRGGEGCEVDAESCLGGCLGHSWVASAGLVAPRWALVCAAGE